MVKAHDFRAFKRRCDCWKSQPRAWKSQRQGWLEVKVAYRHFQWRNIEFFTATWRRNVTLKESARPLLTTQRLASSTQQVRTSSHNSAYCVGRELNVVVGTSKSSSGCSGVARHAFLSYTPISFFLFFLSFRSSLGCADGWRTSTRVTDTTSSSSPGYT